MQPDRIHLLGHAHPIAPDIRRFGFPDLAAYLAFIREHLPKDLRLTCDRRILDVTEDPWHGGRHDDGARIRDLQRALDDPRTWGVIALTGGAYFSRILPHLNFDALARRPHPLWALGFSEMSTLVGRIARCRGGRGVYWLGPNWTAWRVKPAALARDAFAAFWQGLPPLLRGEPHGLFACPPIVGERIAGRVTSGKIRVVGGCLAVLAAVVGGPFGRRLRPDGHWLLLEDIKESPYRIDRHLAALKHAGWFDRAAGLLIGDFRMLHEDTQPAVLELLRYHLPRDRRVPVITTRSVGHVWPMAPLILNRPLPMRCRGRQVTIAGLGLPPLDR
jgi:muramoyltetrapeptide carboxypeptidase